MSDLYKLLEEYCNSDYYPFHMPGHKRNMKAFTRSPYDYDITEIEGFDNLHDAQGILRIAQESAAGFYGADRTYFLVNGSTCGLLAAISGVTKPGDAILVARNCHKAVYNAIYLRGLRQQYLFPEYIEGYGINGGIAPGHVKERLEEFPDARAVVITSPTYEGVVSDVAAIAKITHAKGIPLIVDEAHGAHFGMHKEYPDSAIALGADLVIQSVHKTLPSLTQTALLHYKKYFVNRENVEKYLHIYQSSSPSYVLMASIDECINMVQEQGSRLFEPNIRRIEAIRNYAAKFEHIRIIGEECIGKNGVFAMDPSKLVISVRECEMTGQELYNKLAQKYHLQLEMAAGDYVIAMTSCMDTEEALLRLFTALAEIDRDLGEMDLQLGVYQMHRRKEKVSESVRKEFRYPNPVVLYSVAEAMEMESEYVTLQQAAGRISTDYVYVYPPGIPIVAPGDMIAAETARTLESFLNSGLTVSGIEKCGNKEKVYRIKVMKDTFKRIQFGKGI